MGDGGRQAVGVNAHASSKAEARLTREKEGRTPAMPNFTKFPRTLADAKAWVREYDRMAHAPTHCVCEHGHFNCSVTPEGPCLDEILTAFPEAE
jgi:hypothetical protein